MTEKIIRGIMVPVPTFFLPNGEVDVDLMKKLVGFYVEAKVHGLFVCGSFGMGPAMRVGQRKQVAELVAEVTDGKLPFVIHCGTVDVYSGKELAQHAQSIGSLAVAIVPPFFYSDHTEYEIAEHYRQIAESVDIPLFIYDNPQYSGIHMQIERVLHLKELIPSIRGIKLNMMTPERSLEYLKLLPEDITAFTGSLPNLMASMGKTRTFDGTIHPPTAHVPELSVQLWEALENSSYEEAIACHDQLDEISHAMITLWKEKGRVVYKEPYRMRGFDVKMFPRWPSTILNADDIQFIHQAHQNLDLPNVAS